MLTYKGVISIRKRALFLVSALLIISLIIPAQAESPIEEAKRVKDQISSMRTDLSEAFDAHERSVARLEKLDNKIVKNTEKLRKSQTKLKKSQKRLSSRISSMYRYGQITVLDVFFSAKSFNEFINNFNFIMRIEKKDAEIIKQVKILKNEIASAQNSLITDRNSQRKAVALKEQKKDYIESKLAKAKKMMAGLEKEIAELSKPKIVPAPTGSSSPAAPTSGNYAFPVGQPYSFSNDWHAPRTGHLHQGNDILAPKGTPAYAITSGTVSNTSGGSAGLWQILRGNDGNTYWYMHMNSFATSGQVSAGQVIGYVGNTGNAAGGPSHVHFEYHPGGGGAANPYFFLVSIQ